jgi:small subunit ribosomal protein S16
MLTLRLARAGTKKRPVYHLVAADQRARRDGNFIENLGYFIPEKNVVVLAQDRIDHWMSVGARVSETAAQVIKRARKTGNVPMPTRAKYVPQPTSRVEPKAEKKAKPAEAEASA